MSQVSLETGTAITNRKFVVEFGVGMPKFFSQIAEYSISIPNLK